MDLEDVEESLQINKNVINTLLEFSQEPETQHRKVLKLMQIENDKLHLNNKALTKERNALKDEILLLKQLIDENENKIEEISIGYDMEINRLLDQNDRKEYALQYLEQRLVELECFLRELAQNDEEVREHLKYLKVNPDLKKK